MSCHRGSSACRTHSAGQLTDGNGFDDQATLAPDGKQLAFVSTREGGSTNIWILEFKTRKLRNLTDALPFTPGKLHSHFRPAWSPDGRWLAFSSDRDTQARSAAYGS